MGLTDSDAILMCVPLRYQSREVIPYDQWQVKSEVILEGQIVRPARTMRIRGGKTMTKFQLERTIALRSRYSTAPGPVI